MATNTWRAYEIPEVIWGQRNPTQLYSSTVVAPVVAPEESVVPEWAYVVPEVIGWQRNDTQLYSSQTNPYFSNRDVYALQSQWYANAWNTAMADAYWSIANNLWMYSSFANNSLATTDALLNYIRQNEQWLQRVAWDTYNTLVWDIQGQRDYINRMFGPEWELTQEVNKYYDDLWNYLATDVWKQMANIAAQWTHSWASLWAIRAQQNEAYNEAFWRYIQAKEQQINAKQQIASNLINYMSKLREEYWNTTNQYIIDLYKRANDMYNSIAQSAAQDIDQYNQLLATPRSSWWGSSSWNSILDWLSTLQWWKEWEWSSDDEDAGDTSWWIRVKSKNQKAFSLDVGSPSNPVWRLMDWIFK